MKQIIINILILVFFLNASGFAEIISETTNQGVYTLAPDIWAAPISGVSQLNKNILSTYIGYKMEQAYPNDIGILGEMNDVHAVINRKELDVMYSEKLILDMPSSLRAGSISDLVIVPCSIDSEYYFVLFFSKEDGESVYELIPLRDFKRGVTELYKTANISKADYTKLIKAEVNRPRGLSIIDESDQSLKIVYDFLAVLSASTLSRTIDKLIKDKELFISEKELFTDSGFIVNRSLDINERAWSIFEYVLLIEGVMRPVREKFKTVFNEYLGALGAFTPDNLDPELGILLLTIQGEGIKFPSHAYRQMIDVCGVDVESKNYLSTLDRIQKIYREVAFKEHGIGLGESGDNNIVKIVPNEILPYKIKVEKISDNILPVSVLKENNGSINIVLNEHFIKVMTLLSETTLKDEYIQFRKSKEDGFRPLEIIEKDNGEMEVVEIFEETETAVNAYDSILYSIALYDLCGHFKVLDKRVILDLDVLTGQSKRGDKYLFPNISAIMYFWYAIVRNEPDVLRAELQKFIEEHPYVVKGLDQDQIYQIKNIFSEMTVSYSLFPEDNPPLQTLDRIGLPTPAVIFQLLKQNVMSLEDMLVVLKEESSPLWSEYSSMDEEDGGLGKLEEDQSVKKSNKTVNKEIFLESIKFLRDIGLIVPAAKEEENKIKVLQMVSDGKDQKTTIDTEPLNIIPLSGSQIDKIENILLDMEKSKADKALQITKAKIAIYEQIEPQWAMAVVSGVREIAGLNQAESSRKKTVVAIETGWIPQAQVAFIQPLMYELEKLERYGGIEIVRGDDVHVASILSNMISSGKIDPKEIILLGNKDLINKKIFEPLFNAGSEEKVFFAGVDPSNLEEDSYVRLLEIIEMALCLHSGHELFLRHSFIDVSMEKTGYYIFYLKAEPFDLMLIKRIYDAQKNIIMSA